jgi:hypothetical protein
MRFGILAFRLLRQELRFHPNNHQVHAEWSISPQRPDNAPRIAALGLFVGLSLVLGSKL